MRPETLRCCVACSGTKTCEKFRKDKMFSVLPVESEICFFFFIFFLIQVITDSDYHFLNSDARTFQIHGLHVLAMLKSNCG